MKKNFLFPIILVIIWIFIKSYSQSISSRPIWFGTTLDAQEVMSEAQKFAKSLADPSSPKWRSKGDQRRTYRFTEANADEPFRVCVPSDWDGMSKMPLAMFLHGAGSNESTYLDQNNKQMVKLALEHGYLLVSPMGDKGAYGNFLRLTSPFGDSAAAARLMAQVTPESERTNELSEKDVINVLELVLAEYPIDRSSMFLFGHSMGSGGTWYIGGKYRSYWRGLAPMSGPFVQESGYPWDSLRQMFFFVTEGTQTPSLDASRLLADWLKKKGFNAEYKEVNADHGGMISLVLPDIFDFFDRCRKTPVNMQKRFVVSPRTSVSVKCLFPHSLLLTFPSQWNTSHVRVSIIDLCGRERYFRNVGGVAEDQAYLMNNIVLPSGAYNVWIRTSSGSGCAAFTNVK